LKTNNNSESVVAPRDQSPLETNDNSESDDDLSAAVEQLQWMSWNVASGLLRHR